VSSEIAQAEKDPFPELKEAYTDVLVNEHLCKAFFLPILKTNSDFRRHVEYKDSYFPDGTY